MANNKKCPIIKSKVNLFNSKVLTINSRKFWETTWTPNPLLNHLPDHHAWLTFSVRSLDITKIKMKFEMILWQLNITNKADKSLTMFQSSKNSNSSMLKICNIKQAKCTKAAKNAANTTAVNFISGFFTLNASRFWLEWRNKYGNRYNIKLIDGDATSPNNKLNVAVFLPRTYPPSNFSPVNRALLILV